MSKDDETSAADETEEAAPDTVAGAELAPETEDEDSLDLGSTGELMAAAALDGGFDAPNVTVDEEYVPSSPVVTGLRPRLADCRGGTSVMVLGAGFAPGCRVYLDGEEHVAEVIDGFMLRFVAPPCDKLTAIVEVESIGGKRCQQGAELDFAMGPALFRCVPEEVPIEGGVHIVIEGERFADGCTINVFGMHAPEAVFDGPTRISFLAPPAGDAVLEGTLIVMNPDGLSGRSETIFRYKPLDPKITAIEPARGWISGGKVVVISGFDFHQRVRATVGGKAAVLRYKSRNAVEIEVPETEAIGPVDVVLINPDGRETKLEKGFTYEPVPAPPKIIDVIPRSGSTTGGATVRITGDNFTEDCRVKIGELTAMRKFISAKLIDAELPARTAPGAVAIEIQLEGVKVRAEDIFTYESPRAPKISHVEPRGGPTSGGTRVVIEGDGFPPNASVRFGRETAKVVAVKSANRIETVAPAQAAGMVDVEVVSLDAGSGVSKAGFKYENTPPPSISLVAPNKGTIDGGTELSVEGKNFAEGAVIVVNGVVCKTRRISGSVLEAKTPEGDDGKLVDVAVKNPDGQQAIQKRAFQYDARYRS